MSWARSHLAWRSAGSRARATSARSGPAISARRTSCARAAKASLWPRFSRTRPRASIPVLLCQHYLGFDAALFAGLGRVPRAPLSGLAAVSRGQGRRDLYRSRSRRCIGRRGLLLRALAGRGLRHAIFLPAALIAAAATPFFVLFLKSPSLFAFLLVLSAILIAKHHQNIRNLISGHESKIGQAARPPQKEPSPAGSPPALEECEKRDRLRLIRTPHVGVVTFWQLLDHFGSASAAIEALPEFARYGSRVSPRSIPKLAAVEAELSEGGRRRDVASCAGRAGLSAFARADRGASAALFTRKAKRALGPARGGCRGIAQRVAAWA